MATGLGKTIVFSEVAKHYQAFGKVLILAHREELIWQAQQTLMDQSPGIEMAQWHDATASKLFGSNVTIGTVQTVSRRLHRMPPHQFSLVVIDEAHHATATTYRRIVEHFAQGGAKILGVTATPKRADKKGLGSVFATVAFAYDLPKGILDGWLVPIGQFLVENIQVDFRQIKQRGGDYDPAILDNVLSEEQNLHAVAKLAIDAYQKHGSTLVFTASVRQAELTADIINRYQPQWADYVSEKTPTLLRRGMIEYFRNGQLPILVNCMIATEGFDAPNIAALIMARPTKSILLYTQMLGRGTRPLAGVVSMDQTADERRAAIAASKKPRLYVYDLVSPKQIQYVVTVADALLGKAPQPGKQPTPEWKMELANQAEKEGIADVLHELEERDAFREALQSCSRRAIRADAISYEVKTYHPFTVLDIDIPFDPTGTPITQDQANRLQKAGVDVTGLTFAMAEQIIDHLNKRKQQGLASYKQCKLLASRNIPTEVLVALTRDEASRLISSLQLGGWYRFATTPPPKSLQHLQYLRQNHTL